MQGSSWKYLSSGISKPWMAECTLVEAQSDERTTKQTQPAKTTENQNLSVLPKIKHSSTCIDKQSRKYFHRYTQSQCWNKPQRIHLYHCRTNQNQSLLMLTRIAHHSKSQTIPANIHILCFARILPCQLMELRIFSSMRRNCNQLTLFKQHFFRDHYTE